MYRYRSIFLLGFVVGMALWAVLGLTQSLRAANPGPSTPLTPSRDTAVSPPQGTLTPTQIYLPLIRSDFVPGWRTEPVALSGNQATLALDSTNRPYTCYYTNFGVYCAQWDGLYWQIHRLYADPLGMGHSLSLVLDSHNQPHVSYDRPDSQQIDYAWISGTQWLTQTIGRGNGPILALDSADQPHIGYLTHTHLIYSQWNGHTWISQTVTPPTATVGLFSLALDGSNTPHIVYFDSTTGNLIYTHWDGSQWLAVPIAHNLQLLDLSLALDSATHPHLTYYDGLSGHLWYVTGDGAAPPATWQAEKVAADLVDVKHASLALDKWDRPHISYSYGYASLWYGWRNNQQWSWQQLEMYDSSFPTLVLDSNGRPHLTYVKAEFTQYGQEWWLTYATSNVPLLAVHDVTIPETAAAALFTVTLNTTSTWPISFTYTTVDGTAVAGTDYTPTSGHLTLPPGQLTATIPVTILNNSQDDGSRYFHLRLTPPIYALLIQAEGRGTINDDDSHWQTEAVGTGEFSSLALDSSNAPHISYTDPNGRSLQYTWWDGSQWQTQWVDKAWGNTSLRLDASDTPHIGYNDFGNYMQFDLRYAHWDGVNWLTQTVEFAPYAGQSPSLALDSQQNPHLSYYDWGSGSLNYAHWDGSQWQTETVKSGLGTGATTKIQLDSNDQPHIVIVGDTIYPGLQMAYFHLIGGLWVSESLPISTTTGHSPAFVLDAANHPYIAYQDAHSAVAYTWWDGTQWQHQVVATTSGPLGALSLALDDSGHVHIGYIEMIGNVIYTWWDGAQWVKEFIDQVDYHTVLTLVIGHDGYAQVSYTNHNQVRHGQRMVGGAAMPTSQPRTPTP